MSPPPTIRRNVGVAVLPMHAGVRRLPSDKSEKVDETTARDEQRS